MGKMQKPHICAVLLATSCLLLLDVSISSAMVVNKCKTSFVSSHSDIDYLKKLIPPDHKIQNKITQYQMTEEQLNKPIDEEYQRAEEEDINNPNKPKTQKIILNKIIKAVFNPANREFFKSAVNSHPEVLKFKTEKEEKNLLHLAILENDLELAEFLAQFKELINQPDSAGVPPLFLSIMYNPDIFKLLLTHPHIDVTIKDNFEDGLFHYIFLITERGDKLGKTTTRKRILNIVFKHLDANTTANLITSVNKKGESSIHYLTRDFDSEIAEALLSKTSINFSQLTTEKNNFFHIASMAPNIKAISFLLNNIDINIDPLLYQENLLRLTPIQIMQSHYPHLSETDIKIRFFKNTKTLNRRRRENTEVFINKAEGNKKTKQRRASRPKKNFMSYESAQQLMREEGITTVLQFEKWSQEKRPVNFPSNPYKTYSSSWTGWGAFLGAW